MNLYEFLAIAAAIFGFLGLIRLYLNHQFEVSSKRMEHEAEMADAGFVQCVRRLHATDETGEETYVEVLGWTRGHNNQETLQ